MRFNVYLDTMTFPHRALTTSEGESCLVPDDGGNAPRTHNACSGNIFFWRGERHHLEAALPGKEPACRLILFGKKRGRIIRRHVLVKQSLGGIHSRIG